MDSTIFARVMLGVLGGLAVHSAVSFMRGRTAKSALIDQLLMFSLFVALFWERAVDGDGVSASGASLKIAVLMLGLLAGRIWERGGTGRQVAATPHPK